MRKGFGPEADDFRAALKMRKRGATYQEIGLKLNKSQKIIQGWIEGILIPIEMNPIMAEQWRQSSLFGFSLPIDRYRGRGL